MTFIAATPVVSGQAPTTGTDGALLAETANELAGAPAGSRARRAEAAIALVPGELVLGVKVNGDRFDDIIAVQDADLGLLIERADLANWRVATPDEVIIRDNVEYVALANVPGVRYSLDLRAGVLALTVEPSQFQHEERALYDLAVPDVLAPGLGAFLNYDAEVRGDGTSRRTNAYVQLGVFGHGGVLLNDWALDEQAPHRLNTTFVHDSPEDITTLRVGDFTGASSTFNTGLPIGGIQWGTNFATRPGLIKVPLQRIQGQVSVPSTVEIYVNGSPIYRTQVQPGPFTITDIPVVTGTGTVQMVITDPLGRRQVVDDPFYSSPIVLRAGLTEFSLEVGARRIASPTGFGLEYDEAVARALHRTGVTDRLTAEILLEGSETLAMLGSTLAWVPTDRAGVIRIGLASSSAQDGNTGALGLVGYELARSSFSVVLEAQHETEGFSRIGGLPPDPTGSRTFGQLSLGFSTLSTGNLSFSLRRERNRSPEDVMLSTITWSKGLGTLATLSLSAGYDAESEDSSGSVNLSIPLGGTTNASFNHFVERNAAGVQTTQSGANLQRGLGTGPSWGYRFAAGEGGDGSAEFDAQGDSGAVRLGATRTADVDTGFAAVSGSLVFAAGGLHASRRLSEGFAVVQVPGAPEVGVYADNSFIGTTDEDGELLVPNITPYRRTRISLDPKDLPLEVQLKTDKLDLTVPYRSASVLGFPADLTRAYTARLVRSDDRPVPAGANLFYDDQVEPQPIGSDGFAYLALDPGPHVITARWADSACSVRLIIEPSDDPQPDLGVLRCEETSP